MHVLKSYDTKYYIKSYSYSFYLFIYFILPPEIFYNRKNDYLKWLFPYF